MVWTVIGIAAAILNMSGFIPQILKMGKTKSVDDVSRITLIQFSVGITLWIFYGIHLGDVIIIGANAFSLATVLVALGMYIRLSRNR